MDRVRALVHKDELDKSDVWTTGHIREHEVVARYPIDVLFGPRAGSLGEVYGVHRGHEVPVMLNGVRYSGSAWIECLAFLGPMISDPVRDQAEDWNAYTASEGKPHLEANCVLDDTPRFSVDGCTVEVLPSLAAYVHLRARHYRVWVDVRAKRPLPPGEKLTLNFGAEYWFPPGEPPAKTERRPAPAEIVPLGPEAMEVEVPAAGPSLQVAATPTAGWPSERRQARTSPPQARRLEVVLV